MVILRYLSREHKNSILNSNISFSENLNLLLKGKISLSNKKIINVVFDTICLHTDHAKSIDFIKILSNKIKNNK